MQQQQQQPVVTNIPQINYQQQLPLAKQAHAHQSFTPQKTQSDIQQVQHQKPIETPLKSKKKKILIENKKICLNKKFKKFRQYNSIKSTI